METLILLGLATYVLLVINVLLHGSKGFLFTAFYLLFASFSVGLSIVFHYVFLSNPYGSFFVTLTVHLIVFTLVFFLIISIRNALSVFFINQGLKPLRSPFHSSRGGVSITLMLLVIAATFSSISETNVLLWPYYLFFLVPFLTLYAMTTQYRDKKHTVGRFLFFVLTLQWKRFTEKELASLQEVFILG